MTEKMLIIHDVQYFNYATVHFTDDHPTDDLENYFDWELEPAPPKDWQERLHKVAELTQYISETGDGTEAGFNSIDVAISRLKDVATLKQQIKELEDANRYLARAQGKQQTEEYDPKKVQDTISCLENAKMLIPYYPDGFGEYTEYVHGLIDGVGWQLEHILDEIRKAADMLKAEL